MTEMAQHDKELVDDLFARARAAQRVRSERSSGALRPRSQSSGLGLNEEGRNLELATMAVEMTGLERAGQGYQEPS